MPGRGPFGTQVLRDAVRRRVDETSIRTVAEEIGMSPSGLHILIRGSTPHPATREKLVSWYLRTRKGTDSGGSVSKADVDAAIRLIARYVRQGSRPDRKASRLREAIRLIESAIDLDAGQG